jgi:ferredoxin
MKTTIYFFSGTGNSLAVARKISSALGDSELVPVASFRNTPGKITPAGERIGIVCPVYFSGLPLMVAEWAARLSIPDTRYLFAVVTLGETGGGSALRQLDAIMKKNSGKGLDAGFTVKMPGNYIFMYAPPEGRKREGLLEAADLHVEELLPVIERCERKRIPGTVLGSLIRAVIYPWFSSHAHARSRQFSVTPACTSCGTCVRVCPAENIELLDGRPVWKDRCEVCCACIHLCPVQAIQAGKKTEARPRYRHPAVSTGELESRDMKKS